MREIHNLTNTNKNTKQTLKKMQTMQKVNKLKTTWPRKNFYTIALIYKVIEEK